MPTVRPSIATAAVSKRCSFCRRARRNSGWWTAAGKSIFRARDVYRDGFPGLVPGKRVRGPLRLPDVKPPCSNLAGTMFRPIFFPRAMIGPLVDGDRQQVKETSDGTAGPRSVDPNVL